jgi:sugar lactone lactonase YvrE
MTAPRIVVGSAIIVCAAQMAPAEEVWRAMGFAAPESALLDGEGQFLYVSNVVGELTVKDGAGHISRLALDGTVQEMQWASGLDAPTGMALRGETLIVADVDRLVGIDVASGEISGSWPAEGAQFLNDVAVDEQGRVFVSDILTNRIYLLDGDTVSVWVEGEQLMHPNGLAVADGRLIVAAWGSGMREDFTTEVPGRLLAVDLERAEVSDYGLGMPVGNLDGIRPDGNGNWLVTDWISGGLLRIDPDGSFEQLVELPMGSADLEFVEDRGLAVIPMMLDDAIAAHRIDQAN